MAKIRILGATLKSFAWHPQTDDDKDQLAVIQIEANLTKRLADQFGKDWVFDDKGVARSFDGRLGIGLTVDGGTVELGDRLFEIVKAWKFYIFAAKDADNDLTLKFDCRIQVSEGILELLAWCAEKNAESFGVVIAPNQMAFNDDEEESDTAQNSPSDEGEKQEAATTLPRMEAINGRRKRKAETRESCEPIPTDASVPEWRCADEVADGVPHHVDVTQSDRAATKEGYVEHG